MPIDPSKRVLANLKVGPRKKFSVEEQKLRDLWNEQEFEDDNITPKSPPQFRKEQPTIIGPELAKIAEKFFNIAPNLRGKTPRIQYGPNRSAMSNLWEGGRQPHEYGRLNLIGTTSNRDQEISLNPSLGSPSFLRRTGKTAEYGDYPPDEALAHELTHAAGYPELEAETARYLARNMKTNASKK